MRRIKFYGNATYTQLPLNKSYFNFFYFFSFVETLRKFVIAKLSIHKLGCSSVLIIVLMIIVLMKIRAYSRKLCNDSCRASARQHTILDIRSCPVSWPSYVKSTVISISSKFGCSSANRGSRGVTYQGNTHAKLSLCE